MSDQALIINAPGPGDPRHEMEMQRRLKDGVLALTTEIVDFHTSSHALVGNLTKEIVTFRESSDDAAMKSDAAAVKLEKLTNDLKRYTAWLVRLTIGLVVLTLITIGLAIDLIRLAKRGECVHASRAT